MNDPEFHYKLTEEELRVASIRRLMQLFSYVQSSVLSNFSYAYYLCKLGRTKI